MFHSTRLKLTAWYLLIIMLISIVFSVVIFTESNRELNRFERMQRVRIEFEKRKLLFPRPPQLSPKEIQAARVRLIITLVLVNLGILGAAGIAGYFLAGKTLTPIQEMVDEQNRFITDSSHEFRTPLTSLRSEIEVGLRDKNLDAFRARKLLQSNLEEILALQALSDNLLELAQSGKLVNSKNMGNVSLVNIVKTAIKKVEPAARKKNITIQNKVKDAHVLGVEDRLVEVFVVLLDNAVKYSKKGAVILSSKMSESRIEISVVDQGSGIEKADLPHIFDRFYRASKSRSETPGYGLGLSIAKKIIDAHGGKITVASVPHKKTTFTLSLPLI